MEKDRNKEHLNPDEQSLGCPRQKDNQLDGIMVISLVMQPKWWFHSAITYIYRPTTPHIGKKVNRLDGSKTSKI